MDLIISNNLLPTGMPESLCRFRNEHCLLDRVHRLGSDDDKENRRVLAEGRPGEKSAISFRVDETVKCSHSEA